MSPSPGSGWGWVYIHTVEKKAVAKPLSLAGNMSAMTPPALVKGELPNVPAMKRSTMSVCIFCDPAAPALKIVNVRYCTRRLDQYLAGYMYA